MLYQTKTAAKSLGVVAPLIAILVIALGMMGVDISGDVAGLPEKIAASVDSVLVIVAIVAGIVGRLRAETKISGWFTDK